MSVRHIHANPGEYIAVHRDHRYHGGGGSGGSGGDGCFEVLGMICLIISAIIVVTCIVVTYWKVLLGLVAVGVAGWLIWIFRRPIWRGICWTAGKLWNMICAGYGRIKARGSQGKATQTNAGSTVSAGHSSDYGKIRQRRR